MRTTLVCTIAAFVMAGSALAATPRRFVYEDTLPAHGAGTVSLTVRAPAAFRIVMRTSTQGRTRLYLLGKTAPKGGPLIDTKTYACEGAAGSFSCRGSYEALPRGTYIFRVRRDGAAPTHVQLTVRW